MPKRQKAIDWTPANDARLILTILAVENVHPNCEAVATAFGGGVDKLTISNRLSRLRRKAVEEGLVPKDGAAVKGRKGGGGGAGKKGDGGKQAEDSESQNMVSDNEADSPPARKTSGKKQKVLTGRVTKARGTTKKDAKGKISDDMDAEIEGTEFAGVEGYGDMNVSYDEEDDGAIVKKEEAA